MNFAEVFPNDVPGISIEWEIYVGIDMLLETNSISISAYRMTPVELKEMKAQLKNFLDKCFIRANIYPWGALVLFVKK